MNELTERERSILELICVGKTDSEIAMILGLSEGTVKQHVRMCLLKMDSSKRVLAALRYDRMKRS